MGVSFGSVFKVEVLSLAVVILEEPNNISVWRSVYRAAAGAQLKC